MEVREYSSNNCLSQSIALLLQNQKADTRWLMANNYSIEYSNKLNSDLIYKKLRFRQAVHYTEFCTAVYGMVFKEIPCNPYIWDHIKVHLQEQGEILIGYDTYYAPWHEAYEKTHVFHYSLVTKMNDDHLVCLDAYMDHMEVGWKKELFMKAVKTVYCIKMPDEIPAADINKVIRLMICQATETSIRNNYEQFIFDLENVDSIEQIFENDNPRICELLIVIKRIAKDCENLAELFEFVELGNKREQQIYVVQLFQSLQNQWELITVILLRIILRKRISANSIKPVIKILKENVEIELEIYRMLKSWMTEKGEGLK